MAETRKATARRVRERFFEKYCKGRILDIGPDDDPITPYADVWTWQKDGDAIYMQGKPDYSYNTVYASHVLEDIDRARIAIAIRNWWRLVIRGGYLIIVVPHRDLYERKKELPSKWNPGHRIFWLMDRNEKPDTFGLLPMIRTSIKDYEIMRAVVCDDGNTITDPDQHADGEYSIEVVLKKQLAL